MATQRRKPVPRVQTLIATLRRRASEQMAPDRSPDDVVRRLINRLPVAALVADDDGRYVAVNEAACALTGYSERELLRRSVFELTPNVNEREGEMLWRAFLQQRRQHGDYKLIMKSGRIVTAEYAATHIGPGLHVSLLCPKRSERRKRERRP